MPARGDRVPHRLHHPSGDDDDVQPRRVRPAQRSERTRLQNAVVPDERAVEVGRDDLEVAREVRGKDQPFGLPPVAFTT